MAYRLIKGIWKGAPVLTPGNGKDKFEMDSEDEDNGVLYGADDDVKKTPEDAPAINRTPSQEALEEIEFLCPQTNETKSETLKVVLPFTIERFLELALDENAPASFTKFYESCGNNTSSSGLRS